MLQYLNVAELLLLLSSCWIFPEGFLANFGDQSDVYDEKHIKQHLEDKLEIGEREMTKDEERFHYFTMNDLNKDHFLDGIEVWKAIHHRHNEEGELTEPPLKPLVDEEVEKAVDEIMTEIDLNGDGKIDYSEYLNKVK